MESETDVPQVPQVPQVPPSVTGTTRSFDDVEHQLQQLRGSLHAESPQPSSAPESRPGSRPESRPRTRSGTRSDAAAPRASAAAAPAGSGVRKGGEGGIGLDAVLLVGAWAGFIALLVGVLAQG